MGGSVREVERVDQHAEVFQGREHRQFAYEHEDAESKQGQNAAGTGGVRLVAAIRSSFLGFDAGEGQVEGMDQGRVRRQGESDRFFPRLGTELVTEDEVESPAAEGADADGVLFAEANGYLFEGVLGKLDLGQDSGLEQQWQRRSTGSRPANVDAGNDLAFVDVHGLGDRIGIGCAARCCSGLR